MIATLGRYARPWVLAALGGCAAPISSSRPEACRGEEVPWDRVDNDCDDLVDCEDPDLGHLSSGAGADLVTADDLPGLCDGWCRMTVTGDLRIEGSDLEDLDDLQCVAAVDGDLHVGFQSGWIVDPMTYATESCLDDQITWCGNSRLGSLAGLGNLTRVGGRLVIFGNGGSDGAELTSLDGLGSLGEVGGDLHVLRNEGLSSLTGLEGLLEVHGDLSVTEQRWLETLSGLDNLHAIDGELVVSYNDLLADLTGLGRLEGAAGIRVEGNPSLGSLRGLGPIRELDGSIFISGNDSLASLEGLDSLTSADVISIGCGSRGVSA